MYRIYLYFFMILISIGACNTPKNTAQQSQEITAPVIDTDTLTLYQEYELDEKPKVKGGYSELLYKVGYPEAARKARAQGTVIAKVIVLKSGQGINHEIHQSVDPILDKEVLKALKTVIFEPGIKNSKPVNAIIYLDFDFQLDSF